HLPRVRIDVLAEQRDFDDALCGELAHFREDVPERPADLVAAGVRYDAEAAVLAAALHDRYERCRARGARLRQVIEFLDLGKADVDDRPAGALDVADHGGETMQGLRAEHEVDEGRP